MDKRVNKWLTCFGVKKKTHFAEAVSWDITLGAARTKFGKMILSATSESKYLVPDSLDHAAIKVYGFLYEYGDSGILKTQIHLNGKVCKSKYTSVPIRIVEPMGETDKSQEEFDAWIEEQSCGAFAKSKYNLATTSCVTWAKEAATFLEVTYPGNWDKITLWTAKNKGLATFLGNL